MSGGDWGPTIAAVVEDKQAGIAVPVIAVRFHNALVNWIVEVAEQTGLKQIVLSGGVFQNRYLTESAAGALASRGFVVHTHQRVAPNDGGIALGLDRVTMLLAGEKSIREVIAFAKTTAAVDLMAESPSEVDQAQLELLAPISTSTPAIARRARELHSLSDDLGEDHDLAMLHQRVAEHMRDFPRGLEGTALLNAIERSRRELQTRALSRGGRLYRRPPARLARSRRHSQ